MKQAVLFGQNLWRDGGRTVVITEGELDALSMSQALTTSGLWCLSRQEQQELRGTLKIFRVVREVRVSCLYV